MKSINEIPESLSEPIDPTTPVEYGEVNAKRVLITGICVLLGVWAVVLLTYPFFSYLGYSRTGGVTPSKVLVYQPKLPPAPRIQSDSLRDYDDFRARQQRALNSYNWVDRGKGVVSIPIGRAMRIVAQRGIPPSAPGGREYYKPAAATKITGFEGKVEPAPR